MDEVLIVGKNLTVAALKAELARAVSAQEVVGLDTETEGINPKDFAPACGKGTIVCWSISTSRMRKVFLWASELETFRYWLEDPSAPKCGHNIFGFDKHMFKNAGITLRGVVGCTQRMSRLLYCCKMRNHGLKALGKNQLGVDQDKFKDLFMRPQHRMEELKPKRTKKGVVEYLEYLHTKRKVGDQGGVPTVIMAGPVGKFGKKMEFIPLSTIPTMYPNRLQALYEYATLDADLTRRLYLVFLAQLRKKAWKVYK